MPNLIRHLRVHSKSFISMERQSPKNSTYNQSLCQWATQIAHEGKAIEKPLFPYCLAETKKPGCDCPRSEELSQGNLGWPGQQHQYNETGEGGKGCSKISGGVGWGL